MKRKKKKLHTEQKQKKQSGITYVNVNNIINIFFLFSNSSKAVILVKYLTRYHHFNF